MHSKSFLHRDMKPENMTIGSNKKSNIAYLIDFGLAKRYLCPKTGQHIPFKEGKGIVGTQRYLSLNGHMGNEHGRRDDLEALGIILIYFLRGG
jgi:serine/threonine protein kinase